MGAREKAFGEFVGFTECLVCVGRVVLQRQEEGRCAVAIVFIAVAVEMGGREREARRGFCHGIYAAATTHDSSEGYSR
jgi:hypothetical protein